MGVPVSKERAAGTAGPCAKAQSSALDVSQMWDTIHSLSPVKVANSSVPLVRTGWTTVRVFVSSTFEDFNSERELLVKQVFPALREWCEARNLCLVECDLRWGIPQDTPSGKILATCLGELDRCHQDTMGKPFMVILLGQRAGWIPGIDEVPQGIVEQYSWVNGMSVTGTEILHGAYRSCNANAAFCLREPSFLEKLCPQDLPRYEDKGWSALMLQSLKDQVCKRFPEEQILKYECQVLGTDASTGVDKVNLGFSEDFSSWILHFLQSRILQTFPEHGQILSGRQELSWDQMESAQHELFLWQKHQVFLGRESEVQRIIEFLQMKENDLHDRAVEDHRIPPYQIISEPGLGKSSLVTECIIQALPLANCTLFYHFVGCCSSSVQLSNIAMRLCCHLMPAGQECNAALERLKNCWRNEEIKDIVKGLFSVASVSQEKTLYIFIDAINQLSVLKDASDFLSWLSEEDFLPPFCRCVISSTPYSFSPDSTYIMQLEPLPSESAQNLVVMYLSRYTKKLSPKQLHLLLQKPSSQNPLWLTMACEELRVFGEFKMVTKKITSLPDTLQGLLENILQRLVHEDKTTSVEKLLCLMYCCSESVTEVDLQGSMSYFESEIPRLHWASLRRTLNCLLRVGRDHRGRDTLSFFHGSVAKAVEQSFLTSDSSRHPYFSSLTYYYENVCPDDSTVVTKLPRLLKEAQFNDRLVQFLRKDQRAKSIQAHVRAHYLKGLRCSQVCREGFPRMPALVCHMCCLKTGAFGQLFLNKDSCAVCGSHAAYMSKEAFQCPQHYRIGRNCCIVCESPILAPLSPSPAMLCNHCGFFPTCISIQTFKNFV